MVDEPLTLRRDPPHRRDLTCRSLDLQLRAETVNETERSVEAVLATENPVRVFDLRSLEVIDEVLLMDGVDIPRQMPLLDNHMRFALEFVLGSARNIRVEKGQLVGRIHFAEGPEDSPEERAWQKVRQGHLTDVSIGYRSRNFVDIPAGQTQTVAGRSFTAGDRTLRITTEWQPREGSVTPIGADEAAKMRQDATALEEGTEPMDEKLRRYLEQIGLRSEATDEQAWAFFHGLEGDQRQRAEGIRAGTIVPADPPENGSDGRRSEPTEPPADPDEGRRNEPTPPTTTTPADPEETARQAVEAERNRVRQIRDIGSELVSESMLQRAVDDGWSVERANREFLEYVRNHRPEPVTIDGAPAGHVRGQDRELSRRSLAAGLLHRLSEPVEDGERFIHFTDGTRRERFTEQDLDHGDRFRTHSLYDFCRHALQLEGQRVPYDRDEMIRSAFSTQTLTAVFTTSIHARLIRAFMEAPDTADWVSERDVANYQEQERVALGKLGGLERLPKGGTAKHKELTDFVEKYSIARYAGQMVVDEIDIVNDNLGGIQQMPVEMGQSARRLKPDLVYSLVLENPTLNQDSTAVFAAGHNNLDANVLNKGNIEAGIVAMMKQTQDSQRLDIRPRFLIVPGDLAATASELLDPQTRLVLAGSTDEKVPDSLRWLQSFSLGLRAEGRIDANGVTDPRDGTARTGSATNWFLMGESGRTIEIGYLAGTGRRPQLRPFTLDKGQYGIGWDVKHSIGGAWLDYRAAYQGNS